LKRTDTTLTAGITVAACWADGTVTGVDGATDSTGASSAFFPEFFPIKALQHDTTHLHYRRRYFLFMGMGMFLFVEERKRKACHIDGQTSEKYHQKH
jgi:hypothetical protein